MAKYYNGFGYVLVKASNHPNRMSNGYMFEHRLVMENHIRRLLTKNEVVHHKNHKKDDNRICNLQLMTITEHHRHHKTINTWSKKYKHCRICKKKSIPHSGNGLCQNCYMFKRRRKDIEKTRKYNRAYMKKYYSLNRKYLLKQFKKRYLRNKCHDKTTE